MNKPPVVLLLASNSQMRQRWESILVRANCKVLTVSESDSFEQQLGRTDKIDVLVTDQGLRGANFSSVASLMADGDIATVGIGVGSFFDVSLPSDYSDRELKIACLLLAENIRLRRSNRREQRMAKLFCQLASSDPLTGLPNRRAWDDFLAKKIQLAVDQKKHLCLGLIDLDHFKGVNLKYGLFGGDKVLKTFGQSLGKLLNPPDFAARLGGDEFGIVISSANQKLNLKRINQLRVQASESVQRRRNCAVTASAGFVEFDGSNAHGEITELTVDLFKAADNALQSAKFFGRDTTVESDSSS